MGKRSEKVFEKVSKDLWPTIDPRCIPPLEPYIKGLTYAEPCAGNGDLIDLIGGLAECKWVSDVQLTEFVSSNGYAGEAEDLDSNNLIGCDCIITNPPYSRDMLEPLLQHLPTLKPTWMLLPADRMHVKYMSPYMEKCKTVLSIGRLKWFRDDDIRLWDEVSGTYKKNTDPTDNYAWFEFVDYECETIFMGRL